MQNNHKIYNNIVIIIWKFKIITNKDIFLDIIIK